MKLLRLFNLSSLALLLAVAATAQTKQTPPAKPAPAKVTAEKPAAEAKDAESKESKEAEITAQHQRGLSLVREAAQESVSFDDKRSAARVQAQAADLLWKQDPSAARELFEKAFDTAVAHYNDTKDDNLERVSGSSSVGRADVRLEVIRMLGRHDAELSKRLTDRYVEEKKRETEERRLQNQNKAPGAAGNQGKAPGAGSERLFGPTDPTSGDLLQAARSLFETDMKVALQLVQRAFANGVPQSAPSFLPELARRDRKAADEIYVGALAQLAANPQSHAGQLLLLSAYPFGENRVWVTEGQGTNSYGFNVPPNWQADPVVIQRFLATAMSVLARAVELNPAQTPDAAPRVGTALFAARVLEPKITKYQPAALDEWQALGSRLHALAAENQRSGIDGTLNEMARENRTPVPGQVSDRVKELQDRAEKTTNPNERDDLYAQAAMQANRDDVDRALSLVDKITDLTYRRTVRSWVCFDAANRATNEKRFEDARRYAQDVEATDQRAYLLFQIASAALKEQNRSRAVELLEEAAAYALKADNTAEKLRALLGLTNIYATINPVRGFELMTEAVKTANNVPNYKPDQAQLVRVLMQRSGRGASTNVNSVEAFDLGKTLVILARTDFERALSLAQSLEQKPLRYTAVLALAGTLFDPKQVSQVQ